MRTFVKIVLTIVAFMAFGIIHGAISAASGDEPTGAIRLIIAAGFIYGIYAIWKYKPDTSDSTDITLNKD
jgi:hypothetical protein